MMDDTEIEAMATLSGSSSIGDPVSERGHSLVEEDGENWLYPERRPSLDLGPSPMDTSQWHYVDQALTPALSYSSMASEERSNTMNDDDGVSTNDDDGVSTRVQLDRTDSYSSCYSMDSDDCEKRTPKVKSKDDTVSELPNAPELIQDPNTIRHPSLTVKFTFKAIANILQKLSEKDVKRFKMMLWQRYPQSFNTPPQGLDLVDLVDRMLECYSLEVSLQVTKVLLDEMGQKKLIDYLETLCIRNEVRHDLCETLKRIYGEVYEDVAMQGERKPFDEVFTDLNITTNCDSGPNIEHEVMTIGKLDSNRKPGKLLSTSDILSSKRLDRSNTKLVVLTGVPGSGKSMAVRRLILDWCEQRSHEHVSFLIPLPFRELRQFEGSEVSLLEIIQKLYPETKKLREEDYRGEDCKIMFVFDGLDEYNDNLDFNTTELLGDYTRPTTLNVIVVNLLRDRLLYRGLFLVTTRPQVRRYIPWDMSYNEIEVLGFRDPDKDEYFKKRFKNPDQATRVIAYINSFKTLRIMCHLPLFCSLVADECQHIFREKGTQAELPRSITYMYTKLLLVLIRQHRVFRAQGHTTNEERDFLMKLGKVAFNMLEQRQFKITKTDWKDTGIDDTEAVINSGLCTQYITKPYVLFQEKVLSFIHPTMQEYLAALYVFLSFRNLGKNIFEQQHLKAKVKGIFKPHKAMELYKSAVDRSLLCEDGKLDLFLRFLFGMALNTNLELLQTFCTASIKGPSVIEDAAVLIKKRLRENPSRSNNLQHCLEELGVSAAEAASY